MSRADHAMFQAIGALQANVAGDLLEIGAFEGRSTIVIGGIARAGEAVHVCDPFEDIGGDARGLDIYDGLAETTFRENYGRFHDIPPVVHRCLSTELDFLEGTQFRFIHIDGSHAFENVTQDLLLSRSLAMPDTVVVLDDFRKVDTPGVSAAVWAAVAKGSLHPLAFTGQKMYASWELAVFPPDAVERAAIDAGCVTRRVPVDDDREAVYAVAGLSMAQRVVLAATPPGLLRRVNRLRGFVGQR